PRLSEDENRDADGAVRNGRRLEGDDRQLDGADQLPDLEAVVVRHLPRQLSARRRRIPVSRNAWTAMEDSRGHRRPDAAEEVTPRSRRTLMVGLRSALTVLAVSCLVSAVAA